MQQRPDWGQRIGTIAIGLALLGVLGWWLMRLDSTLLAIIAAFIVVSGLLPPLIGNFVSAGGWIALSGVIYKWYAAPWQLPAALAILGVFFLASAINELMRARRRPTPDQAE